MVSNVSAKYGSGYYAFEQVGRGWRGRNWSEVSFSRKCCDGIARSRISRPSGLKSDTLSTTPIRLSDINFSNSCFHGYLFQFPSRAQVQIARVNYLSCKNLEGPLLMNTPLKCLNFTKSLNALFP